MSYRQKSTGRQKRLIDCLTVQWPPVLRPLEKLSLRDHNRVRLCVEFASGVQGESRSGLHEKGQVDCQDGQTAPSPSSADWSKASLMQNMTLCIVLTIEGK